MATKMRRGGRKKNEWTVVSLKELLAFISDRGLRQNAFAESLGVTNSTFHNWKNGRCAPDEDVQGKIRAMIDGKEEINVAKKKAKTKKKGARAPRGSGSSTLAALTGGAKTSAKKTPDKKAPKKATKKAKTAKKVGRVVSRPSSPPVESSAGALGTWNDLEALGQFMKANADRTPDEMLEVIGVLSKAQEIFG